MNSEVGHGAPKVERRQARFGRRGKLRHRPSRSQGHSSSSRCGCPAESGDLQAANPGALSPSPRAERAGAESPGPRGGKKGLVHVPRRREGRSGPYLPRSSPATGASLPEPEPVVPSATSHQPPPLVTGSTCPRSPPRPPIPAPAPPPASPANPGAGRRHSRGSRRLWRLGEPDVTQRARLPGPPRRLLPRLLHPAVKQRASRGLSRRRRLKTLETLRLPPGCRGGPKAGAMFGAGGDEEDTDFLSPSGG